MSKTEDQRTDQFKPVEQEGNELTHWLEEGTQKLAEKQFREAIKLFEKVLRVDPDNMTAFEKLSLARSIQADMDHVAEYLAMGRELMNQHDWKSAHEEFQAVLTIDSKNEEALACIKEIQVHLGTADHDQSVITVGGENVFDLESMPVDSAYRGSRGGEEQETAILGSKLDIDFKDQMNDPDFQRKLEEALRIYEAGNLQRSKELLEDLQKENPDHSQVQFYLTAISRRFETDNVRKNQSSVENMFKQGMDLLEQEKFDGARNAFQEVIRLRPDFTQAQLMLDKIDSFSGAAKTERVSGRSEAPGRDSHSSRPAKERPGRKPGRQKATRLEGRGGRSWAKISLVGVPIIFVGLLIAYLLVIYPQKRYDNFIAEAQRRIDQKAYHEAISLLESALVVQPESLPALEMLGEAGRLAGKPEKAVDALQRALQLNPGDKKTRMGLGSAQFENKQWMDAERTFASLTGDITYQDEALFKIAISRKNRGDLDAAITAFQKALEADEANSQAHFELAQCYEQKGMLPEAEAAFHQAINTDPKFVLAYEELGRFYRLQKKYAEGADILNRLLVWFKPTTVEKSKKIAQLRFDLGEMQYESGDYKGAVESFTTVIQIEPKVDAFRNLGRAHYKAGKLTEAILVWRRGIELDDTDYDLWFQIGTAQMRQSDISAAESSFKEALRIKPDYVKALTNLGFLYYQTYKFELARQLWRQSLELDPEQPVVREKMKEIDKAS